MTPRTKRRYPRRRVHLGGKVGSPEAVVYADDDHAGAATVEQGKQGGEATEAGPIANPGGHSDAPGVDERASLADDDDNPAGLGHIGQATQASPAYVIDPQDVVAGGLGGEGSFFNE